MPGNSIEQGWIKSKGDEYTYIAGETEFMSTLSNHNLIGSMNDNYKLQVKVDYESTEVDSYVNKEVQGLTFWREIHLASGVNWLSSPSFFVALDTILEDDEVKQLQRITFREGSDENY